jgi:hypothetical protein
MNKKYKAILFLLPLAILITFAFVNLLLDSPIVVIWIFLSVLICMFTMRGLDLLVEYIDE